MRWKERQVWQSGFENAKKRTLTVSEVSVCRGQDNVVEVGEGDVDGAADGEAVHGHDGGLGEVPKLKSEAL